MPELIDIYDENNKHIGTAMKSEAQKKGLWHRGVHVWVYSEGKVLLQLRSKDKKLFPDMWKISVAGHVRAAESAIEAALRETREELGIQATQDCIEFYRIRKFQLSHGSLVVNQFLYVFTLRYRGKIEDIRIQREELQKVKFFSTEFLKQDIESNPEKYKPGEDYWLEMVDLITKIG